ncbi:MAG TPA: sugar-binding protein [Trebonia sp.]|nr:sugar-binding protein [Trebonia sp.]
MTLRRPGGTGRLSQALALARKPIRRRSRWTAATIAVVLIAAVGFIALGPGDSARLTAASSAASGSQHRSAANAAAASPRATAGQDATASPAAPVATASPRATASPSVPPLGLYSMTSVPYTATGPGGGLHGPQGVSVRDGVVYVSNTGANVVAAIKNGQATLVAGSLTGYGEHGDGGPATSATLFHPAGTAEDSRGDLLIADSGDNVIREVTPDGIIHRLAGTGVAGRGLAAGRATRSQLDHPQAVAVTPKGDVLIADTFNNRVLAVSPAGRIAVVAGTGKAGYTGDNGPAARAELNQPAGVATDARGDIYIADTGNNVIREIDARTGAITTVAGNYALDKASDGLGGYSGDGGPATSARLNGPQGIAVDRAGNLFIADTFNSAIRGVNQDGIITTVGEVGGPDAVATDPAATTVQFFTAGAASVSSSGTAVPPVPFGTPQVDAQQDAIWSQSPVTHLSASNVPVSANVRLMWDDQYLYVLAEVSDSTPAAPLTTTGEPGNAGIGLYDDSIDVWINWTNSATASYTPASGGAVASHYNFTRNDVVGTNFPDATGTGPICPAGDSCGLGGIGDPSTVKHDAVSTATGYTIEGAIPWPAGVSPHAGAAIGIATSVQDFTTPGGPRTDYVNSESSTQFWVTPVGLPFVVLGP